MADQAAGLFSPWLRKKRIEAARPFLAGKILDYGCGIGVLAANIEPGNYLGVDIDVESIEIATKTYPQHRFVNQLPEKGRYDIIVALAVVEHVSNPANLLCKISNLLNDNGKIVLTTPHPSLEWIHTIGSKFGLFSREAEEEHETLLNYNSMQKIANEASMKIAFYRKFLFGANQLFILTQKIIN